MTVLAGNVFDIQHFCTHDGPGVRTTVFLKGCPLKCVWCHNPESHYSGTELFFHKSKCVACDACKKNCPEHYPREILSNAIRRKKYCCDCLRCAQACVYGAIEQIGNYMTVDEVMKEVVDDAGYYVHSSGGMTLSGGEPLMQPEFTLALLKAAHKRHICTAVETSGYCCKEDLITILPFTGLFLWDIKATDAESHHTYTGVSNERILDNLKSITALGANVRLRLFFIPELHGNESYIADLSNLITTLHPTSGWEVIPYHRLGTAKLEKLGITNQYIFREPIQEEIKIFEKKINLLINV